MKTRTTGGNSGQEQVAETDRGNMLRVVAREGRKPHDIRVVDWSEQEEEKLDEQVSRQVINGERSSLGRYYARKGTLMSRMSSTREAYIWVVSGRLRIGFNEKQMELHAAEAVLIPAGVGYEIEVLEDALYIDFSTG